MKKLILFAMLIATVLLYSGCEPQTGNNTANRPANNAVNTANTTTSANPEADIKKMMSEMAAALAKNDADAASKFYSDDYHLVTPTGVDQTRAERIADMRTNSTQFESFAYENISVRSYGDTAVAIADVKATGKAGGQPVPQAIKATLVFHKGKDGWKVVSGQATPVTAAATKPAAANTATNSASNSAANTAVNK